MGETGFMEALYMPNMESHIALAMGVFAMIVSVLAFVKSRNSYKRIAIDFKSNILSVICILFFSAILVVFYVILFQYKSSSSSIVDLANKVLDMQANTLTITGISIAIVGLLGSIFTINREKRLAAYEKDIRSKLEESEKIIKLAQIAYDSLSILIVNNSMNDDIFFETKEKMLTKLENNEDITFPIIFNLMKFYYDNANHTSDYARRRTLYKKAMKYSNDIIGSEKSNDENLYAALLIRADCNYYLAEMKIDRLIFENDEASELLDRAIFDYRSAENLFSEDVYGYISNSYGLCNYWLFKSKNKYDEESELLLKKSENYYKSAIGKNSLKSVYYNNLGVCLMAQASHSHTKIPLYNEAYHQFQEAVKHSSTAYRPYLNMADILTKKIRIVLGIEDDPFVLNQLIELEPAKKNDEIEKWLKLSEKHFQSSLRINGVFVNTYYKYAEMLIIKAIYNITIHHTDNNNSLLDSAKEYIDEAELIDSNSFGLLYIKRNYYDVIRNHEKAIEINDKICIFNPGNAEKWSKLDHQFNMIEEGQV